MQGHIPYLNTEYARNKDIECYTIEAKQKERGNIEKAVVVKSPFVLTDQEIEYRLGQTLADIAVLHETYGELKVADVNDAAGYSVVHTAKMDMVHRRNDIKKNGLAERKDANDFCASVLRIEKRLYAAIAPIEDHLSTQEKIVDDEKARIKAELAEKEAARIQIRIDRLTAMGCVFNGMMYKLPYAHDGFSVPQAIVSTCDDTQFELFCGKLQELADVENKRIADEKAAKIEEENRLAKIREEQSVEAKRLADIQSAQDKQAADIKEAQAAIYAEKKLIADAETARLKAIEAADKLEAAKKESAENARIETEAKIKRESEEKAKREAKEKADAEKKAERAPDKIKLLALTDALDKIPFPTMKTKEGYMYLRTFNGQLAAALKDLKDKAESM